jgi:hypothetical protein
MKKLHFEIMIEAKPEDVWDAVVNDKKYREWTSAFHEGSYFEGGWNKGDSIKFVAKNEKGLREGMVSEIAESKKYSFISIRHLGYILDDKEDTTSDMVKKWAPAYENYSLIKENGFTKFQVDTDTEDDFVEMFSELWPKALKLLKKVAEEEK